MDSFDIVWRRIEELQGAVFHTVTGKPFTYTCGPASLVPDRTKRNLSRSQFQKAYARLPVSGPGELHDLQGPSYLFAVLTDARLVPERGSASPHRPRPGVVTGA